MTNTNDPSEPKGNENIEFLISQYFDGDLTEEDNQMIEHRMAIDAAARETLDQYERINRTLQRYIKTPAAQWNDLRVHIRQSVAPLPLPGHNPWRISFKTVKHMAIAAVFAAVATTGLMMYLSHPVQPAGELIVSGLTVEQSPASAITQIQIGPSPMLSQSDHANHLVEESISVQPPHIEISASEVPVVKDDGRLY